MDSPYLALSARVKSASTSPRIFLTEPRQNARAMPHMRVDSDTSAFPPSFNATAVLWSFAAQFL